LRELPQADVVRKLGITEQPYRERETRVNDASAVRVPDGVPVFLNTGCSMFDAGDYKQPRWPGHGCRRVP